MKNFNAIICLLVMTLFALKVNAKDLCEQYHPGYVVGFFNGVGNSRGEAYESLDALKNVLPSSKKRQEVKFDVFYNTTENTFYDIIETYKLLYYESDADRDGKIDMAGYWYRGASRLSPELQNVFERRKAKARASAYEKLLESRVLLNDLAAQRIQMEKYVLEGKKMLLVAHSEGNLFANAAYDSGTELFSRLYKSHARDSIKLIHVAPASTSLRGPYILADTDLVIKGVPRHKSPNIKIPFKWGWTDFLVGTGCRNVTDLLGHSFVGTYMNPDLLRGCYYPNDYRLPYNWMVNQLSYALSSLKSPESPATEGFFTITLKWEGEADLDLVVREWNGTQVYYGNKVGKAGRLDYDSRKGPGIEHYYGYCESDDVWGVYDIRVSAFSGASNASNVRILINSLDGRVNYISPEIKYIHSEEYNSSRRVIGKSMYKLYVRKVRRKNRFYITIDKAYQ